MTSLQQLVDIMAQLRDPQHGCPWDRQQTYSTLVPYTIEEAYEVAEAIERGDYQELKDELGDLLFQVVFYAQIASEEQRFTIDDVIGMICDKLVRRHPHVFADDEVESAEHQTEVWESLKQQEREQKQARHETRDSALDGVISALPALMRAQKIQRRAARVGFDWDDIEPVYEKIVEETQEVRASAAGSDAQALEEEVGDLLFAVVNLARFLDVDAETALRRATDKFTRRFHAMETRLDDQGKGMQDMNLAELDVLWESVKQLEKGS